MSFRFTTLAAYICGGLLFAVAILLAGVLLAGLNEHLLSFYDFDEGVYWQALRSMRAGYHLYGQIYHSQPPFFLLSIYPFYALLGSTLQSAQIGVMILCLLGLVGAYLMGQALGGRIGSIAALALLIVSPMYLVQSQRLQAEGPATAFIFLAVGAAFMWRRYPTELRGYGFAILSAIALSLGILTKLFNIIAAVPILVVVMDRFWEMRKKPILSYWAVLQAIAAAILVGAIVTLIVLAPFVHYSDQVTRQVVTFHIDAKSAMSSRLTDSNIEALSRFFATNVVLSAAASIGLFIAILRRDRRVFPLAAWLLATLALLMIHTPLFPRHTIVLIPPLIALVALALNDLPEISIRDRVASQVKLPSLTIAVPALATVLANIPSDYRSYRDLKARGEISVIDDLPKVAWSKLVAELERSTTPDQWIVTDAPYLAALANRSTPPWLVDPSIVRVLSGYLSTRELIEGAEDRRVHAVLFATGRLTAAPAAGFHDWVATHFNPRYLDGLGSGVELWVR